MLAGGISDGHALRAAQALGCDLAYMGTKFIATRESMADPRYKAMLVASSADDILLTTAFTGLQTNMLRPSIVAAGLDPDDLPPRGAIDIGKDIDIGARETAPDALARHLERGAFDLGRHRRAVRSPIGGPHARRIPRRGGGWRMDSGDAARAVARDRSEAENEPKLLILLVPAERIEPPTFGLQNRCSTAELNRHLVENA